MQQRLATWNRHSCEVRWARLGACAYSTLACPPSSIRPCYRSRKLSSKTRQLQVWAPNSSRFSQGWDMRLVSECRGVACTIESILQLIATACLVHLCRLSRSGSFAKGYKVLQRIYKFGGQPYFNDFLTNNYKSTFQNAFGERNGKSMMSATAGR